MADDTQLDIMEIKATLKKMQEDINEIKYGKYVNSVEMQDMMYNTWLNQYNECALPPTQGCNIYNEDGTLKEGYLPKNADLKGAMYVMKDYDHNGKAYYLSAYKMI